MGEILVDLFAEDSAQEAFLRAMVTRISLEEKLSVRPRPRTARGGHGKVLAELDLYMEILERSASPVGDPPPDLLVVTIDANCKKAAAARSDVLNHIMDAYRHITVVACPDPHVERWYMADPVSFQQVVGRQPVLGRRKCKRNYYKNKLAAVITDAGYPPTLSGTEFALKLVMQMDLYRAGKNEPSLGAFVEDLRTALRRLAPLRQDTVI